MEDTGLQGGAADLREQELLLDYTLKVQDQEFRVHKFVLASVSDYFCAMLCGSMSESRNDFVELHGLDAKHVSELLNFVYTAKSSYISENPKEMLELAFYFQMPKVISKSAQELQQKLSVDNCLDFLSAFKTLSMDEDTNQVKSFMKDNMSEVMAHYSVLELTPDGVEVILDNWSEPEWEMFQYVQTWIHADLENREQYTNTLMSMVRFSIMSLQEIGCIKQTKEFSQSDGSWKDLVEKASVYHNQSILQRVADDSDQTKFRFGQTPYLLDIGSGPDERTAVYMLDKKLDKTSYWRKCPTIDSPEVSEKISHVIEANNFLITCSEFGANQTWQVFDPLKLSWATMSKMPEPRDDFAMVYYDKHLYVLGGSMDSGEDITDAIDEYSFETNSWSSTKKLPVAMMNHCACVFNGSIYVCGGDIDSRDRLYLSTRLDCLDVSSNTWMCKAPFPKSTRCLKMSVMMIAGKEVLVVIDNELRAHTYNPITGDWAPRDLYAHQKFPFEYYDEYDSPIDNVYERLQWSPRGMILTRRRTIYILNIRAEQAPEHESRYWETHACLKWKVVEDDECDMASFRMEDFPVTCPGPALNVIGGVLAFSDEAFQWDLYF